MNDFDYDVVQKKKAAYGAKHKKGKLGRRGCRLPSDNLTKSQIKKLNGEVYTVNLNKPITYEEYKQLTTSLQQQYYEHLVNTYHVGVNWIAKLMGVKHNILYQYNARKGIKVIKPKGGKARNRKRHGVSLLTQMVTRWLMKKNSQRRRWRLKTMMPESRSLL